ncbi:MAG: indole-3-glycerol phosphate synthase TrpC [Methanomicrobiales archaeon]
MIKITDIIHKKKNSLHRIQRYKPLFELKKDIKRVKIRNNFKNALSDPKDVKIICEYKPASPSAGEISDMLVEDVVSTFEKRETSAISILTEENFFKSSIENLKVASKISKLPLLRKDFILTEYQIYESRAAGASAVLLIADTYPDLREGIALCEYLGMDALVECKNENEINMALEANAKIIGVNNRNFHDFSIDFNRTKELSKMIPSDIVLVSESGVKTNDDVKMLCQYGADAILVGTTIMASSSIPQKVSELVNAAKNSKIKR